MPLLRKTGARQPWLPGPLLSENTDPLRRTIVIGMVVPCLLLGGCAQLGPARPLEAGAPLNTDPRRPAIIVQGQTPLPGAISWQGAPARLPSTDPLRPVITVQDVPDSTLAQPNTTWASRLPRDEDLTRPARPAQIHGVAVPLPGANVEQISAPRDVGIPPPERLALTQLIVGQPPVPSAATVPIGRITSTPTDRLAPTQAIIGQQPIPAGRAVALTVLRDQVVLVADRLAQTAIVVGQQPIPSAIVRAVGVVHADDRAPLSIAVIAPQPPVPGFVVQRVGRVTLTPTDPIRPLVVIALHPPVPLSFQAWMIAPKPTFLSVALPGARQAIVAASVRVVQVAVVQRVVLITGVRQAIVVAQVRFAIVPPQDRDGTP